MTIRPKTVRRLLILATSAVVIAAAVGVAFSVRQHLRESEVTSARDAGMKAFADQDYSRALKGLGQYVVARPNDVEALFALGSARMAVETPNRQYLFDARQRFQQLLQIDPNHVSAALKLLEIYDKTNQSSEMLAISTDLLSRDPANAQAMRFRAIALTRLGKTAEAREAWSEVVRVMPNDVNAQSQLLTAMNADGEPSESVVTYARQIVDAHPDDVRFRIPLATALRDAGREAESLAELKALTEQKMSDPLVVLELVTMLDRARAFDDAQKVLERAADTLNSSVLNTALVQRMWQNGRFEQVITLSDRMLRDGRPEPTVLALRAISLAATQRRDEAIKLLVRLTNGSSASEIAWSEALGVEFSSTPLTAKQRVEAFTRALGRDPNNGILYTWLARSLMQIGEIEQAARCYRESAQRMPSWPTPCIELAQAMLNAGRIDDAIPAAKAAYLRSPLSPAAQVQLARVRFASLQQRFDDVEQRELLRFVSQLRLQLPGEQTLVPIHLTLVARSGEKDEARQLIERALASKPSPATVLEMYEVDQKYALGQSDAILTYAKASGALSPELLTACAFQLYAQGRTDDVNAIARSFASAASSSSAAALAEARVKTLLNDRTAADTWRSALARFPDDLNVQMAALEEAMPLLADRALQAQAIERVRTLTSEDGIRWRIYQTEFLASSNNVEDARQALTLATDLVRQQPTHTELRILLARVLTRLDGAPTALEHLRIAYDQSPANPVVGLELVDALVQLGRASDAQIVLKRLSALDLDDSTVRNRLARTLVENGLSNELLAMLQRGRDRRFLDETGTLLMAETLWTNNQPAAAAMLYEELVSAKPSPATLASAAAFQREMGDAAAAQALISRISSTTATSAAKFYALARYHAKFGEIDSARTAFAQSVADPASDVSMLREAIAMECAARNYGQAEKLVDLATRRFPNHPQIQRARAELVAMRGSDAKTAIADLIVLLSQDPSAKAEVDALRAVEAAQDLKTITPDLAIKLARLADRYPASFELQRHAIQACVATNQNGPAITIAHRVAGMSSARADMQELAARTFARFGQWNSARRCAEQWRAASLDAPRDADLLLAAIAFASGKSSQSIEISQPYVEKFDPATDLAAIEVRVSALSAMGRPSDGFTLLDRWIDQNAGVRGQYLRMAMSSLDAASRLSRLVEATPAEATIERTRLAAAYLEASDRADAPAAAALVQKGFALIKPLADASPENETTAILLAELQRAAGDAPAAEATLRALLNRVPESPSAKNSLAYVLMVQNRNAEEAHLLATAAADAMPDRPSFVDTHARSLMLQGDMTGAGTRFNDALRLDPNYLDALVGLAVLRDRQGHRDEAQVLLARIDELLNARRVTTVPAHLRGELNELRQQLTTSRE